jgi:hypothetical protein
MIISAAYHTRSFSNESRKDAYNKAMNWLAKNVITKPENQGISFKVEEVKPADVPTFKLTLMCELDVTEEERKYCEICKSFHRSFFINEEFNCSACKHKAYLKRIEERISIRKSYKKEKLQYLLDHK